MIVSPSSIPSAAIPPAEGEARRATWTLGHPVRLADGESWWLPRIESTLSLFEPELMAAVARSFHLASEVCWAGPDLDRYALATEAYHKQLADLGVLLLRFNYDLPDGRWRRLLAFEHLGAMLQLTLAVSEEVINSVPAWMPSLLTAGSDAAANSLSELTRPTT